VSFLASLQSLQWPLQALIVMHALDVSSHVNTENARWSVVHTAQMVHLQTFMQWEAFCHQKVVRDDLTRVKVTFLIREHTRQAML